jgi:hypothetical protein
MRDNASLSVQPKAGASECKWRACRPTWPHARITVARSPWRKGPRRGAPSRRTRKGIASSRCWARGREVGIRSTTWWAGPTAQGGLKRLWEWGSGAVGVRWRSTPSRRGGGWRGHDRGRGGRCHSCAFVPLRQTGSALQGQGKSAPRRGGEPGGWR